MSNSIDFREPTNRLDDVLYEVEEFPIETYIPANNLFEKTKISTNKYKSVVNMRNQSIVSVVSSNYKLISNQEAIEYGKEVYKKLFPSVNMDDWMCYKVITPKTLSYCHLDFVHRKFDLKELKQDSWIPFLRISNSYNRSLALSFNFGFVRTVCSNGLILTKNSIRVKYFHTKDSMKINIDADFNKFSSIQNEFLKQLKQLKQLRVETKYFFPLIMKFLSLKFNRNDKNEIFPERERLRYEKTKDLINNVILNKYKQNFGDTAYTLLNVITDFASHQDDYKIIPGYAMQANSLYGKASVWIEDFIEENQKHKFNITDFLGKEYLIYLN